VDWFSGIAQQRSGELGFRDTPWFHEREDSTMLQRTKATGLKRGGLTLIELIVVLVILVALAGMLVVTLPSMLGRAHTASGATNVGEVTKFVQVYEQLYQSQPTDLDALTDTTTAAIPDYLPGGATPVGGQVSSLTLTATQADALTGAGISRLAPMHPNRAAFTATNTPTFNPYSGGSLPVTTGVRVLRLTEAVVEGPSGLVSEADIVNTYGDVYVVFGFGKRCSMVGKVTTEPPTHFGDSADDNAANVYGRVGLVYRIARGTGTTGTPASIDLGKPVFIGAVALHGDGIAGGGAHIEEYYNLTKAQ
jgi:type II secretory pathway pseudopilin PulG